MARRITPMVGLSLLLPVSVCIAADEPGQEEALFRVKEQGKWGFINRRGEIVIAPQFDGSYYRFSEGLAAVELKGKWGYIDRRGKWVIQPQYQGAEGFKHGIAAVRVGEWDEGGGWRYIDRSGQWAFTSEYDVSYSGFKDGRMRVRKEGVWGYIGTDGKLAIPLRFKDADVFSEGLAGVVDADGSAGFINPQGEWVIRLENARPYYPGFGEGLAPVRDLMSGKVGYIDRSGKWVIQPRFKQARAFAHGVAAVCDESLDASGWPQRLWGVINRDGEWITEAKYYTIWEFEEGMAKAVEVKDGIWGDGFIAADGRVAIACQYSTVDPFHAGLAYVRVGGMDDDNSWSGYIDQRGRWVWKPSDFRLKEKAWAKTLAERKKEEKRVPTIPIITERGSKKKGLHLIWPRRIAGTGERAGRFAISVINYLDEDVFLATTGFQGLSYSLKSWSGGSSSGGGGWGWRRPQLQLVPRTRQEDDLEGRCGCGTTRLSASLPESALGDERARGTVSVKISGYYRSNGKAFSEWIKLPIELIEEEELKAMIEAENQ